jgi:DNA modification methylase
MSSTDFDAADGLLALGKTRAKAVIEPCCGTAPACRAAKDAGLHAVGVEVEERYCEVAARRLEQAAPA